VGRKHAKRRLRLLSGATISEAEQIKEAVNRGEQIYSDVSSLLGRPGTYEPTEEPTEPADISGGGSIFEDVEPSAKAVSFVYPRDKPVFKKLYTEKQISPEKAVGQIVKSPSFKIASKLTAESEQLLNREGPLYERFQRSISSPILQRGAQIAEQSIEEIKSSFASGGRARREGLKEALKMQAQIEANEFVGQQMAQASFNLDAWARDNARATLQFNQAWSANLAGVRETYINSINAAREFMATSAIPAAVKYNAAADALSQKKKTNWVQVGLGVVTAAIGVIGAPFTGGASLSLVPTGMSMATEGFMQGQATEQGASSPIETGGSIFGSQILKPQTQTPPFNPSSSTSKLWSPGG